MVVAPESALLSTRPFRAGSLDFVVTSNSPEFVAAVEEMFRDLDQADVPAEEFLVLDTGYKTIIRRPGATVPNDCRNLESATSDLVTAVNRLVLDSEPDRLHIQCNA